VRWATLIGWDGPTPGRSRSKAQTEAKGPQLETWKSTRTGQAVIDQDYILHISRGTDLTHLLFPYCSHHFSHGV